MEQWVLLINAFQEEVMADAGGVLLTPKNPSTTTVLLTRSGPQSCSRKFPIMSKRIPSKFLTSNPR